MRIYIEPLDVLLFRDGKPFSAGDDHFARSIFPPLPRTLQGAIRAAVLSRLGFNAAAAAPIIGDSEGYGMITRMCGPFLARQANGAISEYFPLPLDLGLPGGDEKAPPVPFQPHRLDGVSIDLSLPYLAWAVSANRFEARRAYIYFEALCNHLAGRQPAADQVIKESEIAVDEVRTGIRRSHQKHTADEGQLYSVAFKRLSQGWGFTFDIEGIDKHIEAEGMLVLGGESRPARYLSVPDRPEFPADHLNQIIKAIDRTHNFRLYLATPALFSRGWLPASIDPQSGFRGNLRGIPAKLLCAAIGRYIPAGGWDLRPIGGGRQGPRPVHRAVPAGSVYWFSTEAAGEDVIRKLHFKCVSDEDASIGYGLSLIGGSEQC